jgi:EmrB/QacA subfamily drug resistance transporter
MNESNSTQTAAKIDSGTKTIVAISLAIAVFFLSFMMQALNVALPVIGREFSSNAAILGWMVTVYVLAASAFSIPFGRLADIVGLKKILIIGTIIYTLSSTAAVFSNSSEMLIICRAAQGISAAMILVNCPALITVIYPAEERGRALGINITGVYLGSSLGPFLGGILTGYFGWRSVFLINIPISLAVILLLFWKVKGEWCACKGQKVDYGGWVIYDLALVIFMVGFSLLPAIIGAVLIVTGIIGLGLFLKFENGIKNPMFNINIFRNNRTFILSNLAALINYCAVFAVSFLLSLYLQYIKGFTPQIAGYIMLANPALQAILSPVAGRISDKIEPRKVASTGMALTCIGLLSFIFVTWDTPIWQIIIGLVFIGTGFAFFLSPNTNALMSSVEPKYYGVAAATMSTMISGGQMLSMGITIVITTIIIGGATITPEYYPAFLVSAKIGFGISTVLCFCGIFISLFRGKIRVS